MCMYRNLPIKRCIDYNRNKIYNKEFVCWRYRFGEMGGGCVNLD